MTNKKRTSSVFRAMALGAKISGIAAGSVATLSAPLLALEHISSGEQTCTVTDSHLGLGTYSVDSVNMRGVNYTIPNAAPQTREIHFIQTKECGELRADSLTIPFFKKSAPTSDFNTVAKGDTINVTTFKRFGLIGNFIEKLHTNTPKMP